MSLISQVVRRPVTMLVIILLLVGFSIFSASRLSYDLLPNVEFPEVFISTTYTGASPTEVEENVTKPIEEVIRGIANLDKVTSTSNAGASFVNVTFNYGSGLDQNVANLNERLNRIRDILPDDADEPIVFRFSSSDVPAIELRVTSNRSINDTRQYIDDEILTYFEQVDGVSRVEVSGGQTKQVFIEPSINRLNAYNLTLTDIHGAIATNNSQGSVGTINTNVSDIGMVIENKYENADQLRNIVVAQRVDENNQIYFIRLRDVAEVRFGYDEISKIRELNNRPTVNVDIYKLSEANIIEVSENIQNMVKKLEAISPTDFEFTVVDDNAVFIRDSLSAVSQNAITGGMLAILVLILFLRNFSSVLIIAIAMPLSIVITLMLMYFAGLTINFMSIAGLALGIGMLVDNSIVVLENIYNKRLRGVRLLPASQYGASEMATPILASTLTTVLVFAPLILFKNELGTIGGFFSNLAFTVVASVTASYCVAALFVPVLTSKYLPLYRVKYRGIFKILDDFFERSFVNLAHTYKKILSYILARRKRSVALIVIIVVAPLFLVPKLGYSFAPEFAPPSLTINFYFPTTMKIEEMYDIIKNFEQQTAHIAEEFPELQTANVSIRVNGRTGVSIDPFSGGSSTGRIEMLYVDDVNLATHKKMVQAFLPYKNVQPGVRIRVIAGDSRGGPNSGSSSAFTMELKSQDYTKLQETSSRFTKLFEENLPNLTNIVDDQPESAIEYAIVVDRARANTMGLSVQSIVRELQTAVQGRTSAKFSDGAKEYNIRLRLNENDRRRTDLTEQLYINTTRGTRVPIINLIDSKFSQGLEQIRRSEFQRTLFITADFVGKYTAAESVNDAKDVLSAIPRDEDVSYIFTGEFSDIQKDFKTLGIIFLLAVLFIYGIMASQFESFLDPFIIVFTVPLSFAGVALIYFITQNTISSFTIVGVVMLSGIAVNHGIVLVDYTNLLRRRGFPLKEAIISSAESRLQPILMTSATTIFGLLPIVILNIDGVALIKPLALTVVGGLFFSAFLSLFFIPLIYFGFHRKRISSSEKRSKKMAIKEAYNVSGGMKYAEEHGKININPQETFNASTSTTSDHLNKGK